MKELKSTGVFCLVIGTDRIFKLETTLKTIKNIFGYASYVYAITKMNL
jgi:hypothetical protein